MVSPSKNQSFERIGFVSQIRDESGRRDGPVGVSSEKYCPNRQCDEFEI